MGGYANNKPIVTDGLVNLYDAGNTLSYAGSGTGWDDIVGGDSSTLTNGPTFGSANGGVISFDGVNDYSVTGLSSFTNDLTTGHTIDIWFKSSSTSVCEFFGFLNNADQEAYRFKLNAAGDSNSYTSGLGALYVRATDGKYFSFDCNEGLNDGVWHHLCFVVNNATTHSANGYVDGGSVTLTTRQAAAPTSFGTSTYPSWLGAVNNRGAILSPADMDVAQLKIYNRALTAAEVLQNYNATKNRFV